MQKAARDASLEIGLGQRRSRCATPSTTAVESQLRPASTEPRRLPSIAASTGRSPMPRPRKPEEFTDTNGNGTCDDGEPFEDVNDNGTWDADGGDVGQPGRRARQRGLHRDMSTIRASSRSMRSSTCRDTMQPDGEHGPRATSPTATRNPTTRRRRELHMIGAARELSRAFAAPRTAWRCVEFAYCWSSSSRCSWDGARADQLCRSCRCSVSQLALHVADNASRIGDHLDARRTARSTRAISTTCSSARTCRAAAARPARATAG